ncbi:MAG TPA: VOC family protein [Alphaproteobacteria bacterium]|mgnify:CR=1 FL=1|nr:VOC family protein [Alphaproteobacteria bacterium]HMS45280.1 VOC family protein [Alphaproteobacteria bacterium]
MKENPVGWFEIYVADIKRAKNFYENVFQTKLEKLGFDDPNFEMWSFPGAPTMGGASGALCRMKGINPGHNSVLVYFSCVDCAIEEKRVQQFGGKVQKAKQSIGQYGFISLVYDSEGNMIGLHSMK